MWLYNCTSANAKRIKQASSLIAWLVLLNVVTMIAADSCQAKGQHDAKKLIARGDQLFGSGAVHGSVALYQEAVNLEPTNWDAHYKYGRALARVGQNDNAVKELFQSLLLNAQHPEENVDARAELAAIFMKQGNYDEAGGQLKQVLDFLPKDSTVRGNYAICLLNVGYVDLAIEQFNTLLVANPYDPLVVYNLGTAYMRKGDTSRAVQCFKRVISIDSKNALAYLGLANATAMAGDNQQALQYCMQACRLAPNSHYNYITLGDLYDKLGDKAKAIESYRKAILLNPRDASSKAALSKLLESSRQISGAGSVNVVK